MNSARHNPSQNRFEVTQDDQTAVADYQLRGDVMTVTHIVVPPSLRGQGIASDLARAILAHAQNENLKIVPQCPFMAAFFERHPENAALRV